MNNNDYTDDELKDAPLLKSMNRENFFKVPDGYFDSFPTIISERISAQPSKLQWIVYLQNIFQPKFIVAACVFAVVLTSGVFYFNSHNPAIEPELLLSYEDVSNSAYMDDMDESILVDELSKYSDDTKTDQAKEIENYLIDNKIDISLIENEL